MSERNPDCVNFPPFETEDLRENLTRFLNSLFEEPTGDVYKVGNYKLGVYAFFDYDGEPSYVGQTNEKLRTLIGGHLTNQRTDAVATSVLDSFDVFEIEVWTLPQFQHVGGKDIDARRHLDALQRLITANALAGSKFKAILNEKDPPPGELQVDAPKTFRARIVSDRVFALLSHPDFRIARRALIISRLAHVISGRRVQRGLKRVLLPQAKRLQWLADRRYEALGGASSVEQEEDEGG
jgi:hypothetical protein